MPSGQDHVPPRQGCIRLRTGEFLFCNMLRVAGEGGCMQHAAPLRREGLILQGRTAADAMQHSAGSFLPASVRLSSPQSPAPSILSDCAPGFLWPLPGFFKEKYGVMSTKQSKTDAAQKAGVFATSWLPSRGNSTAHFPHAL